jgi:hypothetical protein
MSQRGSRGLKFTVGVVLAVLALLLVVIMVGVIFGHFNSTVHHSGLIQIQLMLP